MMENDQPDGIDRRTFLRTALAIGGTSALTAVTGRAGNDSRADEPIADLGVPRGLEDLSAFPERQHAWNADLQKDSFGNPVLPQHQLLLFLRYAGTGQPTGSERKAVESAFRTLERAFLRLAGGDPSADNDGLVLLVGYSPEYFDRFSVALPESVGLQSPEAVLRKTDDDPGKADSFDAMVLLSSDNVPVLLSAEEALFGNLDTVNGVPVRGTLSGIFKKIDRRSAFVGKGKPHDRLDNEDIHEDAPLSMGYKSGFDDNLATEDAVSIQSGLFAQGTTMQVSKLRLDLDAWYDNARETRDELMFSHAHSREDIGDIGENLGDDSGVSESTVENLESNAKAHGHVGHAAKTAQARNEDFEPLILRRSEGINDAFHEDGRVDFNFTAVMETTEDFVETRKAMNGTHLDPHVDDDGHGILPFMEVTNRATLLVPPRRLRALPPTRAIRPAIDVDPTRLDSINAGRIPVVIHHSESFDPKRELNIETVRFGPPAAVARGEGATPVDDGRPVNGDRIQNADLLLEFDAAEAGFDEEDTESRLFGKTHDGYPVQSSVEIVVVLGE